MKLTSTVHLLYVVNFDYGLTFDNYERMPNGMKNKKNSKYKY